MDHGGIVGVTQRLLSLHGKGMDRDFRRDALFETIREYVPVRGRCLDFGCGGGYMVERLASVGVDVVGLDTAAPIVELARAHLREKGVNATIVAGDVRDAGQLGVFDAVLCLDVIEHIEDDAGALTALYSRCRPGGRLILTVPALGWLYGERDRAIGHFRRYDPEALRARIEAAGFQIESCRFWNLLGVAPYWTFERVLRKQIHDGLRIGTDSTSKRILRRFLLRWLVLEGRISWLPVGLTLICIARRSE